MKIWIDAIKPTPDETYTHHALNNDEAKLLIKECEDREETIRGINLDENGIELMRWLISRHTKYPILYHVDNVDIKSKMQALFEAEWLLR